MADMTGLASSRGARNLVVATHVSGTPEIIRTHAVGLLVPPHDSQAIRQAILNMFENPHDSGVIRHYAQNFSWDETARQAFGIIQYLCKNR
jgi:glycosyltransferase involved in cell wall biosynthesis